MFPSLTTRVVFLDFTGRNFASANIRSRDDLRDADCSPDNYSLAMFFKAYDVKDSEDFDIYTQRSKVQDIVLYRVPAGDEDKFTNSDAATHSYTSNKDSGSKNTTSKNEPVVENNGSTTVTFDSTDRI